VDTLLRNALRTTAILVLSGPLWACMPVCDTMADGSLLSRFYAPRQCEVVSDMGYVPTFGEQDLSQDAQTFLRRFDEALTDKGCDLGESGGEHLVEVRVDVDASAVSEAMDYMFRDRWDWLSATEARRQVLGLTRYSGYGGDFDRVVVRCATSFDERVRLSRSCDEAMSLIVARAMMAPDEAASVRSMVKDIDAAIDYDMSYRENGVVGAFDSGEGVCQSFAKSVFEACRRCGVPSRIVVGEVGDLDSGSEMSSHMWNEVCLDGVWYEVDATFADSSSHAFDDNVLVTYDNDEFARMHHQS
jgi:hypothetical protein